MKVLKTTILVLMATIAAPAPALADISQTALDFEQDREASNNNGASGWFFTRGAGFDNGKGLDIEARETLGCAT